MGNGSSISRVVAGTFLEIPEIIGSIEREAKGHTVLY
jgi:hypothetical protein